MLLLMLCYFLYYDIVHAYGIVDAGVKVFMIPLNFGTLHCLFPTAHIQIHILSQLTL